MSSVIRYRKCFYENGTGIFIGQSLNYEDVILPEGITGLSDQNYPNNHFFDSGGWEYDKTSFPKGLPPPEAQHAFLCSEELTVDELIDNKYNNGRVMSCFRSENKLFSFEEVSSFIRDNFTQVYEKTVGQQYEEKDIYNAVQRLVRKGSIFWAHGVRHEGNRYYNGGILWATKNYFDDQVLPNIKNLEPYFICNTSLQYRLIRNDISWEYGIPREWIEGSDEKYNVEV